MILRIFLVALLLLVTATIFWSRPPGAPPAADPKEDSDVSSQPATTALHILGDTIILGDQAGWIRILKKDDQDAVSHFMAHEGAIHAIRGTSDGFATASTDGTVRMWSSQGEARSIHRLFGYHFNDAVISDQGAVLVAADKGTVARIDEDGQWTHRLVHRKSAFKLALSPDQARVASVGEDGFLRIWSVDNGENIIAWKAHQGLSSVVGWHGEYIVTGGTVEDRQEKSIQGEIRIWTPDGTAVNSAISVPFVPITRLAMSSDYLAVVGESETVMVYAYPSGQYVGTFQSPSGPTFGIEIKGDVLYVGQPGGQLQTWSVTNGP